MKITLDLPGGGRLELERKLRRKERSSFWDNVSFEDLLFGFVVVVAMLGMAGYPILCVLLGR